MFTHTRAQTYSDAGGAVVSVQSVKTGPAQESYSGTVNHSTTNQELDVTAFLRANVVSIMLSSTKTITLHTNDSGTPIDTIVLTGGKPRIWNTDDTQTVTAALFPNGDVTKIFATNAGGTSAFDATVEIRVLLTQ